MANPFDQFDAPEVKANPFDQFDNPPKPEGIIKGLGKSLKAGIQQLPGMVTGLADIPVALATGKRPFTAIADTAGDITGFQPGKWAQETPRSAEYKSEQATVADTWKGVDKVSADQSASNLDYWKQVAADAPTIAKAYAQNPMYTANQVVQSLPGMVAGGVGGKLLKAVGAVAGAGLSAEATAAGAMGPVRQALPGYVERVVGNKWAAPVVAGVGEGAVSAGQSMADAKGEDQQKNAVAALGAGIGTGLIGGIGGRIANSLGLETAGTAMAKAGDGTLGAGLGASRRILGGAIAEGVFQELPQSVQEAMWQNYADGKPIMQGIARQGLEGALSGMVMGGGANVINSQSPATQPPPVQPGTPTENQPPVNPITGQSPPSVSQVTPQQGEQVSQVAPEAVPPVSQVTPDQAPTTAAPVATPVQAEVQKILDATDGAPGPLASAAIAALNTGATPVAQPTISAFDQREADRPRSIEGDIAVGSLGQPLTNRLMAAKAARAKSEETGTPWQPIELGAKQYVIRPMQQDDATSTTTPLADASTELASNQTAGSVDATINPVMDESGQASKQTSQPSLGTNQSLPDTALDYSDKQSNTKAQPQALDFQVEASQDVANSGSSANDTPTPTINQDQTQKQPVSPVEQAQVATDDVADSNTSISNGSIQTDNTQTAPTGAPNGVTPTAGGFDSKAWNKAREDRINASKKSGAKHLDSVTPSVESMRGRSIYSVHDPKERGVIRTVDNRGNVYVQWSDEYSGGKNSASETDEPNKSWLETSKSMPIWKKKNGNKTLVLQTSLGTTDLKDYVFGTGVTQQPAQPEQGQGAGVSQPTQEVPIAPPASLQEGIARVRAKKAAKQAKPTVPESKLPPTDIRGGDTVRKNGKDYIVTGSIAGGVKAERLVSQSNGITQTETIFLKGDEAIQAKLDAQPTESTNEPQANQTIEAQPPAQASQAAAPDLASIAKETMRGETVKQISKEESDRLTAENMAATEKREQAAESPEVKRFYVTMIRGNQVARLAGPFDTKEQAEAMVQRAREEANKADPRSVFDAFGVTGVAEGTPKPGVLNKQLGIDAAGKPAAITQDDVESATKEALRQIEQTIDNMKADAVQRIAVRFLPTMGIKTPIGKARIKAALSGPKANLLAAAAEFGVDLPASIKRALKAKDEGRVDVPAEPAQPANDEPSKSLMPSFNTYSEANDWAKGRAKSLDITWKEYNSTPEYKDHVYPALQALYSTYKAGWDAENIETGKQLQKAMKDAGVSPGDTVKWSQVGSFLSQTDYQGIVKLDSLGVPYVHLSAEIAVSKPGGRIGYAKKIRWQPYMSGVKAQPAESKPAAQEPVNDRDHFTLDRLNQETGKMEPVTFSRGEFIRYKLGTGEIDGISQAKQEFSVEGLWYPFGYAYKAERPETPKPETVPLSSVIDAVNKKNGQGLTDADAVPNPDTILDLESSLWSRITDGKATVDEFKAGFERWVKSKDAIIEAFSKMKKDELLKMGGSVFAYRNKSENKPEIVESLWREGAREYVLGRGLTYGMGKDSYINAIRAMVDNTDADQLAQYAADRKADQEEAVARVAKMSEAIKDPKTLDDYKTWMRATMDGGKTFKEARMMLKPEQRAQFDDLVATESRSGRKVSMDAQRTSISPAGQAVESSIIATKHTKKGHDLFVVQLGERVSKEDYGILLAGAKRIGGYYSAFRGGGAIPGFQFTEREQAEAFEKLAKGDNAAAQDAAQSSRDAFADDRSQTAAQRLTEMADRLEEQADANLSQERKQNTDKRARQAASAEAAANAEKAMAKTMRNLAQAIGNGSAKFLDHVRQKTQVSLLLTAVNNAKYEELRTKYPAYAEQEKHKGEPATEETADFAEYPSFTAYRSDLASLARQLVDADGTKKMGQQLLKVADDVSDAYLMFVKENFSKVASFTKTDGGIAGFSTKEAAEAAIARSGYKGKAMAYQVKRGEHTVIMSPSEAIERGIWKGDGDKRITLSGEFGAELVDKIGKASRRGSPASVPWQFEAAHDRRKALERMGIETPAEYRAALREFIGLQEAAEAPNKVKQLERAMVGRRNDGMDFFPTPESVADEMVDAAGIEPGMSVLEPSAGWGHIAERIRGAGVEPDVGEISNDRRELLEAKGFNVVSNDFMDMNPRGFTYGDVFKHTDGRFGVLGSNGGLGSSRYKFIPVDGDGRNFDYVDREELTGAEKRGSSSGYDRILMNPPFSDGRDIKHVQHAYSLLRPGGRIVAIMGESAFTNQNKRAAEFREWLDSMGGTSEKLAEGSFNDPSLPATTMTNARMVVVDKSAGDGMVVFATSSTPVVAGKGVSVLQVQQIAQKVLDSLGLGSIVQFQVERNPAAAGIPVPQGIVPTGGASNGKVYAFADNIADEAEAFKVVFHELFHLGLSQSVKQGQYIQMMLKFLQDPMVLKHAKDWKDSADGQSRKSTMPVNNWNALAVEEALATMGELLNTDNKAYGSVPMKMWVKRMITFLADKAQEWGVPRVPQMLRAMTYTQSEKFIQETILKGKSGAPVYLKDTRFSSIGDTLNTIRDGLSAATVTDVKHKFGNYLSDFMPLALQGLGRRQLVEIYEKLLPQLTTYDKLVSQMDADKTESSAEADTLATSWGKLKDERQLAELMHDATRAQIDPSKPYQEGDDKNFYDALKDGYDKLLPGTKEVYAKARDMYAAHHEKVRQAIKERIERSVLSSEKKQKLLEKMDGEFFKKVKGVYFPLSRFGKYLTIVKDSNGDTLNVSRSETMNEAEETRRILLREYPEAGGFTVGKVLLQREFNAARDGVGRGFMADLFETLEKTGASEELQDSISQLYLASLPDLSWAKHGIHRKGTPGFSQDARRAFAQNMFHGANYLSKLRHADQLQTSLIDMQDYVDGRVDVEDYDSVKAQKVIDEMVKRHDSLMNPKSNPISTALTSFGFVFHLGLSPASALVNLSQTALVAYPIMGAKWGFDKASSALLLASKQAASNRNDISKVLTGDELDAYNKAVKAGTIDVTQSHDLAGISQGEDSNLSAKLRPVMKWASFMFHHAERFNRQVTFVASYRLAKQAGQTDEAAYDQATKTTYSGHFDYSASNRARVMQGNVAKVVLLFKQYSQNMIYTLGRNLQQAIQAETPEARKEARRALGGLLVSHALAAGAFGLPVVGTLLALASAIGGDDDEPWDAKVALQNMLADTFGSKAAEVMVHGVSRLTPWDISGRVGLDKLLLPDIREGLQQADAVKEWMSAALGPVAGIVFNMGKGAQDISQGHYIMGLESMMPAALRNPLKSYRYGTEGNIDRSGVAINDEVGFSGVVGQLLGFSPSETRLAQEGKSAVLSADRKIQQRRSSLLRQFSVAAINGDDEGKAEAKDDITRFNSKNPTSRINPMQMMQSVRARRQRIDQAKDGVYLPKKRQDAREAGRFAEVD